MRTSLRSPDDAEPFQRGTDGLQPWRGGERRRIVHILWHGERDGVPIPERCGG